MLSYNRKKTKVRQKMKLYLFSKVLFSNITKILKTYPESKNEPL